MRILFVFLCALTLGACTGGSGSGGSVAYKYQVTGTAPALMSLGNDIATLATNFVLKWNEDSSGNITGFYTNQSTGQNIRVTGTSSVSGRVINATLPVPVSGVSALRFTIAQTGDLNGTIAAILETLDAGNGVLSTSSISVTAETASSGGNGGGGGGGGSTPLTIWDNYGKMACWTARQNTSPDLNPTSMVIDKNGDVYAWGQNSLRRLGLPTEQVYSTPTKLTFPGGAGKITYVTLGNAQGAAIDENHKLFAWGYFTYPTTGNMADTLKEITNLPMGVVPSQIHFSKSNMFIIDTAGKVWAVGGDTFGQMGMGAGDQLSTTFVDTGITNVTRMMTAANDDSVHVLKTDGTVWGWGQATGYRFDDTQTARQAPVQLFASVTTEFTHISRDYGALMAVNENGKIYTWGNSSSPRSKLGRSSVMAQYPAVSEAFARMNDSGHTAITTGTALTTGMSELVYVAGSDGKIFKWGANLFGDGLGTAVNTTGADAVEVSGFPSNVVALKGCGDVIYAVKEDGSLLATGSQANGAIGNGQTTDTVRALSFETIGSLDLKD